MFGIYFFALLILPISSNAQFDFLTDTAKDSAQGAAVVASSIDMLEEIGANASLVEDLTTLQKRINEMNKIINSTNHLSRETKTALMGPQLDPTRRLAENIRYTTNYIRRTKSVLQAVGIISPAAATAINTNQTNMSLNEMLLNQQKQMIRQEEKDAEERERKIKYELFIAEQRAIRNKKQK
jgi:predicted transcriptional regulator